MKIISYSQPSLSLDLRHVSICWAGTELSDLYVVIRILTTLRWRSLCCQAKPNTAGRGSRLPSWQSGNTKEENNSLL